MVESRKVLLDEKLRGCVRDIRALTVASGRRGTTVRQLVEEYGRLNGRPLPVRELGFASAEALLEALPGVVRVERTAGGVRLFGVANESMRHLESLIDGQRRTPSGSLGGALPKSVLQDKMRSRLSTLVLRSSGRVTAASLIADYGKMFGEADGDSRAAFGTTMRVLLEQILGDLLADYRRQSAKGTVTRSPSAIDPLMRSDGGSTALKKTDHVSVENLRVVVGPSAARRVVLPKPPPPVEAYVQLVAAVVKSASPRAVRWSSVKAVVDKRFGSDIDVQSAYGYPPQTLVKRLLAESVEVVSLANSLFALRAKADNRSKESTSQSAISESASKQEESTKRAAAATAAAVVPCGLPRLLQDVLRLHPDGIYEKELHALLSVDYQINVDHGQLARMFGDYPNIFGVKWHKDCLKLLVFLRK